jgi:hypothetical protein
LIEEGCDGQSDEVGIGSDRTAGDAVAGTAGGGLPDGARGVWLAIGDGMTTIEATELAGVSEAVGVRWFRDGGGMPTVTFAPLSGRYLPFAEREESRCSEPAALGFGRSPGRSGGHRRRSHGNCGATPLPRRDA